MSKLKLKSRLLWFVYQQKTYAYCVFCMAAVPLIHNFWRPLNFEFMLGAEMFLGALMLIRHTMAKMIGDGLDRYL